MEFIPGTHTSDQIPHRDTFAKNNLLTRGQEVAVEVDASKAVAIELQPGEMSLHHVRLVHGSPPNPSNDRRIGFAIRYIPTSVKQIAGEDSATLVRGVDDYRHFEHPGEELQRSQGAPRPRGLAFSRPHCRRRRWRACPRCRAP
jgi:ectoine hydroxylase-related dioxygenase (phytanoyl-CoA dioxygenase family)